MTLADLPPLGALRCFEAAARHESFTLAAQELHLTPGAISRAVKTIEQRLGVVLFERRNRRVFLTRAGRRLADATQTAFNAISVASRDLRRQNGGAALVLSCEPTLLMRWLIPASAELKTVYPDIELQLVAAGGPVDFAREGVDVAIRRDDFSLPQGVEAWTFMDEWIGPVCTPDLAARLALGERGAQGLADATLLHARSRSKAWPRWLQEHAWMTQQAEAETFEHFYFSLQAATAGLGVAMGSFVMVRQEIESGVLVAPFGFCRDGSSYRLLTPANDRHEQRILSLLAWLKERAERNLSTLPVTANRKIEAAGKDRVQ